MALSSRQSRGPTYKLLIRFLARALGMGDQRFFHSHRFSECSDSRNDSGIQCCRDDFGRMLRVGTGCDCDSNRTACNRETAKPSSSSRFRIVPQPVNDPSVSATFIANHPAGDPIRSDFYLALCRLIRRNAQNRIMSQKETCLVRAASRSRLSSCPVCCIRNSHPPPQTPTPPKRSANFFAERNLQLSALS